MNAPLQTSAVSIPSVALARMTWRLAWGRAFRSFANFNVQHGPVYRLELDEIFPASIEYYAIIDRISAGEAP